MFCWTRESSILFISPPSLYGNLLKSPNLKCSVGLSNFANRFTNLVFKNPRMYNNLLLCSIKATAAEPSNTVPVGSYLNDTPNELEVISDHVIHDLK